MMHNERCRDCKRVVCELLHHIYGGVAVNVSLDIPCQLAAFTDASDFRHLERIYDAICGFRSQKSFVKARKLAPVDFFVKATGLIVEFDESQHFTESRALALAHYPPDLRLLYPVERWRELCLQIKKRDNTPIYRDEQRAWYDTLRDFAPRILGKGNTARLYSRELAWCSLSPERPSDVARFISLLKT
jgi:hypothetical protein